MNSQGIGRSIMGRDAAKSTILEAPRKGTISLLMVEQDSIFFFPGTNRQGMLTFSIFSSCVIEMRRIHQSYCHAEPVEAPPRKRARHAGK